MEDDHEDQDAYTDPARKLFEILYSKHRLGGSGRETSLYDTAEELLEQIPELDEVGLGTAALWWLEESGQTDFDESDTVTRIAKEAWAAVASHRPKAKRSKRRKPARLQWLFAPFPLEVLNDVHLPAHAKLVAAAIASTINFGKWNERLETTVSYDRLAMLASISRRSAVYAADELEKSKYVERKGRGRAGTRFRFTEKCSRNSATRALFLGREAE